MSEPEWQCHRCRRWSPVSNAKRAGACSDLDCKELNYVCEYCDAETTHVFVDRSLR